MTEETLPNNCPPGSNRKRLSPGCVLFLICLGVYLYAISIGWNDSILDLHAFRQTQTAISVYHMIGKMPKLAYETPILGATLVGSLRISALSMDRCRDRPIVWNSFGSDRPFCQRVFISTDFFSRVPDSWKTTCFQFLPLDHACPSRRDARVPVLDSDVHDRVPRLVAEHVLSGVRAGVSRQPKADLWDRGRCVWMFGGIGQDHHVFSLSGGGSARLWHPLRADVVFRSNAAEVALSCRSHRPADRRSRIGGSNSWNSFADRQKEINSFGGKYLTSYNLVDWNFGTLQDRKDPKKWEAMLLLRL